LFASSTVCPDRSHFLCWAISSIFWSSLLTVRFPNWFSSLGLDVIYLHLHLMNSFVLLFWL
jgi:hypothetical protein